MTQFLTEITSRHKVAILYFREADEPGADSFFYERCEWVEEVVRPASKKSPLARAVRYFHLIVSLFLLRPLWVSDWASPEFMKQARLLAQRFQPEVIQFELHVMGQYVSGLRDIRARRLLVEYESSTRAALYLQNLPAALRDPVERIERFSWQKYERKIYHQIDAIVAFTEEDRKVISQTAGHTPIYIISPGTSIPANPLNPLGSLPASLLFIGNFYHPPNADAARRLAESIFPSVRRLAPDIRLYIIGENPPPHLYKLNSANIIVTGRVPDVIPYLDQAALLVAPLRLGGGMRIKVLESLAVGKVVVTTSLAAEGLDVQDGDQIAFAETDGEFVTRIVELLQNPEKRLAIAKRARDWACKSLTWEQAVAKYETLYHGLLSASIPSK